MLSLLVCEPLTPFTPIGLQGKFTVDGQEYSLAINNGPNSLHGGIEGFSWKFWTATVIDTPGAPPALRFEYTAADMEEGFPGECIATVVYRIRELLVVK